jgi:hypothetical protein
MKEALKLALEALADSAWIDDGWYTKAAKAIIAIKEALAQPVQEPPSEWALIKNILDEHGLQAISFVADWKAAQPMQGPVDNDFFKSLTKKNPSPDQRPWVGLTPWVGFTDEDAQIAGDDLPNGTKFYTTPPAAQPPQPAQEPDELTIAYMSGLYDGKKKRPWVGLKDEDRLCAKYLQDAPEGIEAVIDYIAAKLKELNT